MLPEKLACLSDRGYLSDETCHGLYKKSVQCSLMFYVFMKTLLLIWSASVKGKWNRVNIKKNFLYFNVGYTKSMGQNDTFKMALLHMCVG